jgi:RNA-dependent RNA polymerase
MMQGNIDPFLKAILECKRVYTLKSLRYKARILMPNSFLLLGVIDETGILNEDEIYVQTSTIISDETTHNKIKRERKVWTGPASKFSIIFYYHHLQDILKKKYNIYIYIYVFVVISRNPCLHPGDIRNVKAVNAHGLSHLKNCVVFSQKGYRPLPNMLVCIIFADLFVYDLYMYNIVIN